MTEGFEGAEKILQFKIMSVKPNEGLRGVPRSEWDPILSEAKCCILSECRSDTCTAYVLSESSLFVFENACIFKTCGRTLLLKAIPLVLDLLRRRGLQLEFVLYSSKNYLFPDSQLYPHTSWEESEAYLQQYFPEEKSFVLGSHEDDHIFFFTYSPVYSCCQGVLSDGQLVSAETQSVVALSSRLLSDAGSEEGCVSGEREAFAKDMFTADRAVQYEQCKRPAPSCGQQSPVAVDQCVPPYEGGLDMCLLNMMMYDMDEEVARQFVKGDENHSAQQVTKLSGIASIFPNSQIDDYLFDPCGYSMNGLDAGGFYTIHITPEAHCSYVSFETNIPSSDYHALVEKVLEIFKPKRFSVSFCYHSDMGYLHSKSPLLHKTFSVGSDGKGERKSDPIYHQTEYVTSTKNGCVYSLGNFAMN